MRVRMGAARDELPQSLQRKLERLEAAAVAVAGKGAMSPESWPEVDREYQEADDALCWYLRSVLSGRS